MSITKNRNPMRQPKLFQRAAELLCLKTDKPLPKSTNNLLPLCVFLDESRIIRIGGRLRNTLPEKTHCSIKHPFTEIVIKNEHIRLLHVNKQ